MWRWTPYFYGCYDVRKHDHLFFFWLLMLLNMGEGCHM